MRMRIITLMTTTNIIMPTGTCWCDCGLATKPGSFFLPGHEKRAVRYLTLVEGRRSTAEKLFLLGYIPGQESLRDRALRADSTLEECGRIRPDGQPCRIIGYASGMRRHRADDNQHG
jgi:hypothetical protein